MQAATSDDQFMEMVRAFGCNATARKLGINPRTVFRRRASLEQRKQVSIEREDLGVGKKEYPHRATLNVQDGVVIVVGDSHYWPGPASIMHKAAVAFCKEFKPRAIVFNGDVIDASSASRHPPIGWETPPALSDEIETAVDRLHEIEKAAGRIEKLWNLGNHDCLDIETECLTKRGWLKHTELLETDLILSKEGDEAVWCPINEIVQFPFNGELVCVDKLRFKMAVTPNHRVLLKHPVYAGDYKYNYTEEYYQADRLPYSFDVPTTAWVNNQEHQLTDDQLTLTGWVLTDGHFGKGVISIFQSKEDGKKSIRSLLNRMGLHHSEYKRDRSYRTSCCGRKAVGTYLTESIFALRAVPTRWVKTWLPPQKRLPSWAFELSNRQFGVLLDAIVAGDGTWDGPRPEDKTLCVIYGKREILNDIQAVAATHGWRTRFYTDTRGDYRLWLSRQTNIRIERKEIFRKPYEGLVWCLRVPLGNFMVRRGGVAYFTGNSRFESRLALIAPEYARIKGVALVDHFPNWRQTWSTWINDAVVIKHRFKGGLHAPHNNTLWAGKTMITGHLHSARVVPMTDYNGTRYGVDTGCIADTDHTAFVNYTEDSPNNWRSAFVILTFKNGHVMLPELVLKWDDNSVQFRGKVVRV